VYGCVSLLQSLDVLNLHFTLGIAERLDELGAVIEAFNAEAAAGRG